MKLRQFSGGKRYSLGFNANADYCLPFVSTWRLAGRYGAFLEARGCDGGPDGGAVVRRDLKTGVVVRDDTPAQVPSDAPDSQAKAPPAKGASAKAPKKH